jgi:hypothetical protein
MSKIILVVFLLSILSILSLVSGQQRIAAFTMDNLNSTTLSSVADKMQPFDFQSSASMDKVGLYFSFTFMTTQVKQVEDTLKEMNIPFSRSIVREYYVTGPQKLSKLLTLLQTSRITWGKIYPIGNDFVIVD